MEFERGRWVAPRDPDGNGAPQAGIGTEWHSYYHAQAEVLGKRIKVPVVVQQVISALDASGGNHGIDGLANGHARSEEHTSELQSLRHLGCRLLLEKIERKAAAIGGGEPEAQDLLRPWVDAEG